MSISSKTYNGVAGLNYIDAPELAYTSVYVVKRSGTQYDLYGTDLNRSYTYTRSQGRISFPLAFNEGGEKVFIIYKETGVSDGGVTCTPASLAYEDLPPGRVGQAYSSVIIFTGTPPMTLSGESVDPWVTLNVVGMAVKVTGTPTTEGTSTISFNVDNCSASLPFTADIEIGPSVANFNVSNTSTALITNVTGISYTITSGSFPVGDPLAGSHGNYLGAIHVTISGYSFQSTLTIYKNGVAQESLAVGSDGIYIFTPFTIFAANTINITLS